MLPQSRFDASEWSTQQGSVPIVQPSVPSFESSRFDTDTSVNTADRSRSVEGLDSALLRSTLLAASDPSSYSRTIFSPLSPNQVHEAFKFSSQNTSSLPTNERNNDSIHDFHPQLSDPIPSIEVRSETWIRDSHNLFDYEAQQTGSRLFTNLQYPHTIFRRGQDTEVGCVLNLGPQGRLPDAEPLCRVIVKDNQFCVDVARSSVDKDNAVKSAKLWRIVKDLENGHELKDGDHIKLGRFKVKVKALVVGPVKNEHSEEPYCEIVSTQAFLNPSWNLNTSERAPGVCNTSLESIQKLEEKGATCRICLSSGEVGDPLMKACDCKGSIEYVHLNCLRYWIRGKLDLPDDSDPASDGSYFYRPVSCELCKTCYAPFVKDESKPESEMFPLIPLPKTRTPYIVLERDVGGTRENRGIHVLSLVGEKNEVKLGRGHESDVRFSDVSISRWHASIREANGKFILTDNKSKFGTLVATKCPLPLEMGKLVSLQIGRSVLKFSLSSSRLPSPSIVENPDHLSRSHFGSSPGVFIPTDNSPFGPPGSVLGLSSNGEYHIVSDRGRLCRVMPARGLSVIRKREAEKVRVQSALKEQQHMISCVPPRIGSWAHQKGLQNNTERRSWFPFASRNNLHQVLNNSRSEDCGLNNMNRISNVHQGSSSTGLLESSGESDNRPVSKLDDVGIDFLFTPPKEESSSSRRLNQENYPGTVQRTRSSDEGWRWRREDSLNSSGELGWNINPSGDLIQRERAISETNSDDFSLEVPVEGEIVDISGNHQSWSARIWREMWGRRHHAR